MKPTILLDFDATLHTYKGWEGPERMGPPLAGARRACFELERDHKLVVFTTRPRDVVVQWLVVNGFPKMEVTNVKLPAKVILDDRAVCFTGTWTDGLILTLRTFTPYWYESRRAVQESPA